MFYPSGYEVVPSDLRENPTKKRLFGFQTPVFVFLRFVWSPVSQNMETWKGVMTSRREAERSPRSIFPRDRPGHNPKTTVAGCPRPLPGTRRRAAPVNSPVATKTPHDRFSENRISRSLRRLADGPSAPTPINLDFFRPNKNVEITAGRDTRALVETDARIPEEFVGNNAMTTSDELVKPMGGAKISKQQVRDAVEVRTTATPRLLVGRIPHKSRLTRTPTRSRSLRS